MKKALLFTLIAIAFGLALTEVDAGYRGCYKRAACARVGDSCAADAVDVCQKDYCGAPCAVSRIVEDPCCPPCCERYVRVEEQPIVTKFISYGYECPSGCTMQQKQASGVIQGGQTTYSSAAPTSQTQVNY